MGAAGVLPDDVYTQWLTAANYLIEATLDDRDPPGLLFMFVKIDTDLNVLMLIMTAPMVLVSWINLQCYGEMVNNRVFGSGNKLLHNVSGVIGVLAGNAGDWALPT